MKVILVQSEIEAAIIAAVRNQIDVKEGMQVVIELKQTRGDAGTTAEIDFVPVTAAGSVTAQPKADKPKAVEKPLETPAGTITGGAAETGTDDASSTQVDASTQVAGAGQAEEGSAPAGEAKSLFSNLKKPTNAA